MGAAKHIDTSDRTSRAELKPGLLEREGRTYRVDFSHWRGERAGHMREVEGRWRWVIYPDVVGEEPSREGARRIAEYFLTKYAPEVGQQ